MMVQGLVMLIGVAIGLSGCAAALIPLGASALSGGTAVVRAGTEYTNSGTVIRTFSLPANQLREAVSETFARMELAIVEDEMDGVDRRIVAHARDRSVKLRLEPLTRTVTRAHLSVSAGHFGKDRATASEIVVQIENTVDTKGYAFARTSFSGRRVPD
jgi:hypothetical protein